MNEEFDWEVLEYENEDGDVFTVLAKDGAWQSGAFVDAKRMYDNVFPYCDAFDVLFDNYEGIQDVLMIGGGVFTYPMHVIAQRGVRHCDAVEIDEELGDIAREYFQLEQFEKAYPGKLGMHFMDGMEYLATCSRKYDAIINDVYDGKQMVEDFNGLGTLERIASCLRPCGVYVVNFVGNRDMAKEKRLGPFMDRLSQIFDEVDVVKAFDEMEDEEYCSYVLFAVKPKE